MKLSTGLIQPVSSVNKIRSQSLAVEGVQCGVLDGANVTAGGDVGTHFPAARSGRTCLSALR